MTWWYALCVVAVVYPAGVIVAAGRLAAREHRSLGAGIVTAAVLTAAWLAFPALCYVMSVPALFGMREIESDLAPPVLPRAKVV